MSTYVCAHTHTHTRPLCAGMNGGHCDLGTYCTCSLLIGCGLHCSDIILLCIMHTYIYINIYIYIYIYIYTVYNEIYRSFLTAPFLLLCSLHSLSFCLSFYLSISMYLYLFLFFDPSIFLILSVCLSVRPYVWTLICLSMCLVSIRLSVHMYGLLSVCPCVWSLSVCPSAPLSRVLHPDLHPGGRAGERDGVPPRAEPPQGDRPGTRHGVDRGLHR